MVEVLVGITADMTEYEYDWDISKWLVGEMISTVDDVLTVFQARQFLFEILKDFQCCLKWTSLGSDGNASVSKFHGRSQDSVLRS